MANSLTTQKRGFGALINTAAIVTALCAPAFAHATILDFEAPLETPIFFSGDHVKMGDFWIESYGGTITTDMVGLVGDPDTCFSVSCPVNNSTHYYMGLNDGYMYFGMNDDSPFRLQSLKASFVGNGQPSFPATAGLLVLQGFTAAGVAAAPSLQLSLAGPVGTSFNFANYNMGAFGNTNYSFVRVLGFACDASGACNRNTNLANFAIDDITTVPEPTSWALMGLGLLGLAAFSRRAAR